MKAAGTPAKTSSNGSKTSEPPKIMWSSAQSAILPTPADPDSPTDHDKEGHRALHKPQPHRTRVPPRHLPDQRRDPRVHQRPAAAMRIGPAPADQAPVPAQQRI